MAPINTPEGFVRVSKAPGVAAKLLDAADSVEGADRKNDVRSVTGGYHVTEEVYDKYLELFGDEDAEDGETPSVTDEAAKAEREAAEAEAKRIADEEAAKAAAEQPSEDWTHDQLNDYAAKLTPPLELTGSTPAKAEKLKLIAEHIEKSKA